MDHEPANPPRSVKTAAEKRSASLSSVVETTAHAAESANSAGEQPRNTT